MRLFATLWLATAISTCFVAIADADCRGIAFSFTCNLSNVTAYIEKSGCTCFSCSTGSTYSDYECSDLPAGSSGSGSGYKPDDDDLAAVFSTGDFIIVGVVFCVIGALATAAIYALARSTRFQKYAATTPREQEEEAIATPEQGSVVAQIKSAVAKARTKAKADLVAIYYSPQGKRRSFWQFCVSESKLFDCCWCGWRDKPAKRPFPLRAMRLVSAVLLTISIAFFMTALRAEGAPCWISTNIARCPSDSSRADRNDEEWVCSDPSDIDFEGEQGALLPSLVSSAVVFLTDKVASYAHEVGKPGSKLDYITHALWLLVTGLAIPVSIGVSKAVVDGGDLWRKLERYRMNYTILTVWTGWIFETAVNLGDVIRAYCCGAPKFNQPTAKHVVQPASSTVVVPPVRPYWLMTQKDKQRHVEPPQAPQNTESDHAPTIPPGDAEIDPAAILDTEIHPDDIHVEPACPTAPPSFQD